MLKPLILSALLLAATIVHAQERPLTKIKIEGIELGSTAIPFDCPEVSIRQSLLLEIGDKHHVAIGMDATFQTWPEFTLIEPAIRLGYKRDLIAMKDQWQLRAIFDTRHRYSKGEYVYLSHGLATMEYAGPHWVYGANDMVENTGSLPPIKAEYEIDVYPGLEAEWNFHPRLAVTGALGPTLMYGHYRYYYPDQSEYDYRYSCLELHFFTQAAIAYKFNQREIRLPEKG